jgi:hypothetical protein
MNKINIRYVSPSTARNENKEPGRNKPKNGVSAI